MNKIYYIKYVLFIIFNQNKKILLRHLLVNILMKHFQFRYFSSKLTQITFSKWNFAEISKNNPFWTLIEYYIGDFTENSLFSSKNMKKAYFGFEVCDFYFRSDVKSTVFRGQFESKKSTINSKYTRNWSIFFQKSREIRYLPR